MRFTQLGAATALVAAAHAFLLPPTITEADKDFIDMVHFEDSVGISSYILEMECPGCPIIIPDGHEEMRSVQLENYIRLNFSLSLGDDQLLLNNVQIYPIKPSSLEHDGQITVDQFVEAPAGVWEYAASPRLGYSLVMTHLVSDTELDLIAIKINVLEVGDRAVRVRSITLNLLETSRGRLMIGKVDTLPTPSTIPVLPQSNRECKTVACKWRAIVTDKLSNIKGIKGCSGHGRASAHGKHAPGARPDGHERPRPHGPHHAHRHHIRHGHFFRFVRSIVLHVVLPVIIGVVGGVTAGLVGMAAGHFIVFVWRVMFRGGRRGPCRRMQEENVTGTSEEQKGFLKHQGPPPTYEEDLAFKEAALIEKVSELSESK